MCLLAFLSHRHLLNYKMLDDRFFFRWKKKHCRRSRKRKRKLSHAMFRARHPEIGLRGNRKKNSLLYVQSAIWNFLSLARFLLQKKKKKTWPSFLFTFSLLVCPLFSISCGPSCFSVSSVFQFLTTTLPYALRNKVATELDRLENDGILANVDWCESFRSPRRMAPFSPVRRGDFKISLNDQLKVDQYPLPRTDTGIVENNVNGQLVTDNFICGLHLHSEWLDASISGADPSLTATPKQVSPLRTLLVEWNRGEITYYYGSPKLAALRCQFLPGRTGVEEFDQLTPDA